MKIIKRGVKPQEKLYRGTCSNCKTEFECQQHEGNMCGGSFRSDAFLTVICPVCGKSAYAYERNDGQRIPKYTWDNMAHQMEAGVVER